MMGLITRFWTLSFSKIGPLVQEETILRGFCHIWSWRPSWSCPLGPANEVIIRTNYDWPESENATYHVSLQMAHWFSSRIFIFYLFIFFFFFFFFYYLYLCQGIHLGHETKLMYISFLFLVLMGFHMEFGFNWSSWSGEPNIDFKIWVTLVKDRSRSTQGHH